MSAFFEFPAAEAEPPRPPRQPNPPWIEQPRGWLPGVVPLELLLARNERVAVAVTKIGAYPDGFDCEVLVLMNPADEYELDPNLIGHPYRLRRGRSRETMEQEMLRFGVRFSDGAKATNLPGPGARRGGLLRQGDDSSPPEAPILNQDGGGGGGGRWRHRFWVWPLPPPGPLEFACEWPAAGIELSIVEVDAQILVDAAARAQRIFEDAHQS